MPPDARFVAAFRAALERERPTGKQDVHRIKHLIARESGIPVPRDGQLLAALDPQEREAWRRVLVQKPMRTQSGVAIVAVMSSPEGCPHGKCVFCPGGPEVDAPQSYTGFEPSTMRARAHGYDPYRITRARLQQLHSNGHDTGKVDVIVQGGTFPARDPAYQDWFIAGIYHGLNDGPAQDPRPWEPLGDWQAMDEAQRAARVAAAQAANEAASHRCIGLTVETKPDWCFEPHVDAMLRHGVTRVEVGVQTLDEQTLQRTHRGHNLDDAARALRVARDAGLKVCIHMMPGLPRWRAGDDRLDPDPAMDMQDARRLWSDPRWRPDMLKVYPTLVVAAGQTPLKAWWMQGRFRPYGTAQAQELVAQALMHVPAYCRVQRVDRDIPTTHVEAGVQNTNLRQMAESGLHPDAARDLRGREAGTRARRGTPSDADALVLVRREYEASGGREVMLSLEDPVADTVVAYLRLRLVGPEAHRPEARGNAIVRELKVVGLQVPLGQEAASEAMQHRGFGTRLLEEAERMAQGMGAPRLLVTAGVGVKAYYHGRGYHPDGPYMARDLPCKAASSTSSGPSTSSPASAS